MTTAPLFQSNAGVLIASSDPGFRDRVAANFLNQCAVELASSGADALAKLEHSECDLLILDRNLPDLNADELRELAARDYPGVHVAILDSASPDPFSNLKKNLCGNRTRAAVDRDGARALCNAPEDPFRAFAENGGNDTSDAEAGEDGKAGFAAEHCGIDHRTHGQRKRAGGTGDS